MDQKLSASENESSLILHKTVEKKQGRPELPIGPISVDLYTFDPIIII